DPSSTPAPAQAGVSPLSSEPKPLERITATDRSRADIAARFKEKRAAHGGQGEVPRGMRGPSPNYGPYAPSAHTTHDGGRRTDSPLPVPPPQAGEGTQDSPPQPQPPTSADPSSVVRPPSSEAQPHLVKVKVHGREMFLPEDDVIAEAQKSLAA